MGSRRQKRVGLEDKPHDLEIHLPVVCQLLTFIGHSVLGHVIGGE